MSELADDYELSQYAELYDIDEKGNIKAVKDTRDGSIWVKKRLNKTGKEVYSLLKGAKHENIAYVRDVLTVSGETFVIEEYISGKSLEEIVEEKGCMPVKEAAEVMQSVAEGLIYLHKRNIIHRDIKPSNVMLKNDGRVKLIDLGISRIKKKGSERDTALLGTAGYAAPEQFGFGQTDAAADIYACGVLFNYLIEGRLTVEEKKNNQAAYIIKRCTEIEPYRRYRSAKELKKALIGCGGIRSRLTSHINRVIGFRRNRPLNKIAACLVYAAALFWFCMGCFTMAVSTNTPDFASGAVTTEFAFLYILIPFFIIADFGYYRERLSFIRNKRLKGKAVITLLILLGEFLLSVGVVYITARLIYGY
ncbi:MAG: serine/threonine protein kinase [Clostridiales bacterium]|nr:serine/threonine protein kinase [Clostridiales bacterium]